MKFRKIEILSLVLVLATFVAATLVYPYLPDQISTHWGLNNTVNGSMGKFWGVYMLPIIMLICFLVFILIPYVDPKKENIQKFRKYYDLFILGFIFFFIYTYALIIFWNLGYHFILLQLMSPAFTLLFYILGVMLTHAEPNLTIGIRTPWTLSSEAVWYKTHRLGGKLFKIVAFVALLGIIIPEYAGHFVFVPVIIIAIYLVTYSYLEYHKLPQTTNS